MGVAFVAVGLAGLGAVEEAGGAAGVARTASFCRVPLPHVVGGCAWLSSFSVHGIAPLLRCGNNPTTSSLPSWIRFAGQRPSLDSPAHVLRLLPSATHRRPWCNASWLAPEVSQAPPPCTVDVERTCAVL
jgi:hypothetical protein